ncbi:hypothetical protein C8Q77DRAFT_686246 [Trametes polyzona]|nr:hypothetical protein C8Q77DRAFT_686246 [Trametes polyzona]
MPTTLADVPEEILERILALILVQSPEFSPRPSWHPYTAPSSSSASNPPRHANIVSPLLVCRAWLRIATPIHYRHPVLRTPRHAELLLRALRLTPALAPCVRSLHLHATSPALRDLVAACPHLHTLDITVDNADALANSSSSSSSSPSTSTQAHAGTGAPARVVEFCEAFARARSVRHLVVRKNAYLTQPNATYVFEQLAKAIGGWHKLETVNVAFRLSPSPAAAALTEALAAAPRLHTLYTQLPAVWNTTLLDIAQNPALARIVLSPAPEHAGAHLFLAEAKRHPRLVDLIRAGTAPPSPYPGRAVPHHQQQQQQPQPDAFSFAGIARARAASSAVHAPMPVATWGYEREVPAPVCPPYASSSTSSSAAAAARRPGPGAQPPSAYGYAPSGPQYAYYPHGVQYAATADVPVPAHAAGAFVGGQVVQQKRAAGSRRMTAS